MLFVIAVIPFTRFGAQPPSAANFNPAFFMLSLKTYWR